MDPSMPQSDHHSQQPLPPQPSQAIHLPQHAVQDLHPQQPSPNQQSQQPEHPHPHMHNMHPHQQAQQHPQQDGPPAQPYQAPLQNCRDERGLFQCPFPACSRAFARRYNLATHYATHFGVREWQCEECDRKFTRRYDLTRHQGIKHGPFENQANTAVQNPAAASGSEAQQPQQQAQQTKKRKAPASAPSTPAAGNPAVRRSARNRLAGEGQGNLMELDVKSQHQEQQPDPAKRVRRAASLGNGAQTSHLGGAGAAISPALSHYVTRSASAAQDRQLGAHMAGQDAQASERHPIQPNQAHSPLNTAPSGVFESAPDASHQPHNQHVQASSLADALRFSTPSASSSPIGHDSPDPAAAAHAAARAAAYATYFSHHSTPASHTAALSASGNATLEGGNAVESQHIAHPIDFETTAAALRGSKLSMRMDGDRVSIVRHTNLAPSVSPVSMNQTFALDQQQAGGDCIPFDLELAHLQSQHQQHGQEGSLLPSSIPPSGAAAAMIALAAAAQELTPPPSAHASSRTSSLTSVTGLEASSGLPQHASLGSLLNQVRLNPSPLKQGAGSPTNAIASSEQSHRPAVPTADGAGPLLDSPLSAEVEYPAAPTTPPPPAATASSSADSTPVPTPTSAPVRTVETEEERRAIAVAMLLEIPGTMAQRRDPS